MTDLTSHLLGFSRRHSQPASKVNLGIAVANLAVSLRSDPAHATLTVDCVDSLVAMAHPDELPEVLSSIARGVLALTSSPTSLQISCETDLIQEHIGPATLPPGAYARIDFRAFGSGVVETESCATPFESVLPSRDPNSAQNAALAKAYATVRDWGGDITSSGDSQGALLVLYLVAVEETLVSPPVLTAAEPVQDTPPLQQSAAEPGPTRETILLVDDEAGIRGLVRRILRREHYHVIEAGTGEEALDIAQKHPGPIHLLLTDVMMPGVNGPQLAERVKTEFPSVKVVFITGYSQVPPTENLPSALLLQKPFTMTDLLRVVREAIEQE